MHLAAKVCFKQNTIFKKARFAWSRLQRQNINTKSFVCGMQGMIYKQRKNRPSTSVSADSADLDCWQDDCSLTWAQSRTNVCHKQSYMDCQQEVFFVCQQEVRATCTTDLPSSMPCTYQARAPCQSPPRFREALPIGKRPDNFQKGLTLPRKSTVAYSFPFCCFDKKGQQWRRRPSFSCSSLLVSLRSRATLSCGADDDDAEDVLHLPHLPYAMPVAGNLGPSVTQAAIDSATAPSDIAQTSLARSHATIAMGAVVSTACWTIGEIGAAAR